MLAAVVIIVLALVVLVLALFVGLVVGMRNEPTYDQLSTRAPSPLARLARRMLGVSVRKPIIDQADAGEPREPWFAGVGYTPANRDDEGR
jgi:hypothetical protein